MNKQPLNSFINLVSFDQSNLSLRHTIEQHEQQIRQLHHSVQSLEQQHEQRKRAVFQLRKDVDAKELEMKDLDAQERNKKQLLEQVKNHKEYQAITKDLEHIQQQQLACEAALLQAWNALEHAQEEFNKERVRYEHEQAELQAKINAAERMVIQLKEELAQRLSERTPLLEGIPAEWMNKYITMQARVTNPVVSIERGSCSACYVAVPAQDVVLLRHKALIQCHSCYRLLYDKAYEAA